jgi:23S rRNA (cytosine1962-C5)-methyltransferase
VLRCIVFEDEHLLVVNKPTGWNTHAPAPHAGEGMYDWLRSREPRWQQLAIVHRLDKDTSGVLVFGRTPLANRSLTQQFTERRVRKRYVFLTRGTPAKREWTVRSRLARAGERYVGSSRPGPGEDAETHFRTVARKGDVTLIAAEPRTGRTHQIRVHAADSGVPVLGDPLYDGEPVDPQRSRGLDSAHSGRTVKKRRLTAAATGQEEEVGDANWAAPSPTRLCLHAESITFEHPATGAAVTFEAPADFDADPRAELRLAIIEPDLTDAWRLLHGASDRWPGWYVDRLGAWLLSQSEGELDAAQRTELERLVVTTGGTGAYHKRLSRHVRQTSPEAACPQLLIGAPAPDRFQVRENGLRFELSFQEGYSVGLFLDQRDNRRRLLTGHIAAGFDLFPDAIQRSTATTAAPSPYRVLNVFAYTCAFSVCAAKAGAHVTSLDLSRKYLDRGRRNFELNGLDPASHDFIYGDASDWLARLAKKGRRFDAVLLDPPTFSQSKHSGVFRAEKDYGKLVRVAAGLLQPGGTLFASTNAAGWEPDAFLAQVRGALKAEGQRVVREAYAPQPPDFPISRAEPAYLKTVWIRVP